MPPTDDTQSRVNDPAGRASDPGRQANGPAREAGSGHRTGPQVQAGPSLRQRLRYMFDNTLARGPAALIVWLAMATALLMAVAIGLVVVLGGVPKPGGLHDLTWNIVFQALVPNPPGDLSTPWQYTVVMLFVTVASLAMVSILIGLLSATIQSRVETLRRGRIPIIESGHTVILGWSDKVFDIVAGLAAANKGGRKATIAVLGDADKVEMEDEIRRRIPSMGTTRVVCRRGSPMQHADLALVSPQTSKSIIVLPDDDPVQPDAATLKTILALTKAPNRRPEPYQIVGVLRHERNIQLARLAGGDEVEVVLTGNVIARVIAQTCRQVGLAVVYEELLDPTGDQIYFRDEPALVGRTYGESLSAYADCAVMGVLPRAGSAVLNPPVDTVLTDGDQVIAIARDDGALRLSNEASPTLDVEAIQSGAPGERPPERTLLLGWNWRAPAFVRFLDEIVVPGSAITVATMTEGPRAQVEAVGAELRNQQIRYELAETPSRPALERLLTDGYDHVVVLAYSDDLDDQRADSLTLVTLLHLRTIAEEQGRSFSLVSEMLDVRNRDLVGSARGDDFIVSDRLISLILTQIAQNRDMLGVLRDLGDAAGAEIYLKPATEYVRPGAAVSFATVVEAARRRGESAIGYRVGALVDDAQRAFGVVVNPRKSAMVSFSADDLVVVLAEHQ
jgi:ion channel POLLUX/CASTOR